MTRKTALLLPDLNSVTNTFHMGTIVTLHRGRMEKLSSTKDFNLIIIDQSFMITVRLKAIVNQLGNIKIVGQAKNYEEAIDLFQNEKIDMVLIDIMLPAKKGISLISKIRSISAAIKIIVITNLSDSYYKELCLKSGANHFMDKSAEFEELKSVILQHATA